MFILDKGQGTKHPSLSGAGGRRGKRKRQQLAECEESVADVVEGGEEVVKALLKVLIKDVYSYLREHSLSEHEASRYHLAQVLLRMCRTEVSTKSSLTKQTLVSVDLPGSNPMCVYAWRCLLVLCQSKHGPVEKVVSEVRTLS